MSSRFTRYGLIAAVTLTAASGLFYAIAKSRLKTLADAEEGTAEEIRSAVSASDTFFMMLIVSGVVTAILFSLDLKQRQKNAEQAPP